LAKAYIVIRGPRAMKKVGTLVEAYCLKDRKKVEMKNPREEVMKNKRKALVGTCPICGTKIVKFIKG